MKYWIKIGFAILILCISAQLNIELSEEIKSISISLLSLGVLLNACFLDPTQVILSIVGYVCLGLIGLPVLSSGLTGIAILEGPTLGYLIGFIFASLFIAVKFSKTDHFIRISTLFLLGHVIILFVGVPYYWLKESQIAMQDLILPFLPGLLLKSLFGALLVYFFIRMIKLQQVKGSQDRFISFHSVIKFDQNVRLQWE